MYDGPQPKTLAVMGSRIDKAIKAIDRHDTEQLETLYNSIPVGIYQILTTNDQKKK